MRKLALVLALASVLTLAFPGSINAKDYQITTAEFNVKINPDGSTDITENRTYSFDGSYSWADEWIDLSPSPSIKESYIISDISLSEGITVFKNSGSSSPGNFYTQVSPGKFYIKWYYEALDETKTFTLKYKIQNAITNHSDISEFYWKLIGDEWDKGTGFVSAKVNFPEPVPNNEIWAFGHGPINGVVNIPTNERVEFTAHNLPSGKFFEVRVLFPKLENAQYVQTGNKSLSEILKEEEKFQRSEKNKNILANIAFFLPLFFVTLWVLYWIRKWRIVGDDPPTPEKNISGAGDLPELNVKGSEISL